MTQPIIFLLSFLLSINAFAQKGGKSGQLKDNLRAARESNNYVELAKAYEELALYEEETNSNLEVSFTHLTRSLEYYELVSDSVGISTIKYNIARQLLHNGMAEDAKERLNELKRYYESMSDERNLALVDLQLFDYYFDKLDVKQAELFIQSLSSRMNKPGLEDMEVDLITRTIAYHELLKEYKEALVFADLCLEKSALSRSIKDDAECHLLKGRIFFDLENYDDAILEFNNSVASLSRIPFSKLRLQAYDLLAKSYDKTDAPEAAFRFAQKYANLQDSILNENRVLAINNITYKYESKEKAAEIMSLEKDKAFVQKSNQQQKRALIVLALALAGLLLGIYYIIRFYSDKIQAAKIIEEQNKKINQQKITELQDRIQINSMQSMITGQEVERERIAKDLHDSLGGLLSTIKLQISGIRKDDNASIPEVTHATKLLDVAVSEIRTISQDLQPGALKRLGLVSAINDLINRYQSSKRPEITFQHYDLPRDIDQSFAMGIYRIVQEILNNAIKHAQASEILVQLNKEDDNIIIHIEDDGIGFNPNKKYKSMGLANIHSRVNYLKGSIDIDSRIGQGTSFLIHLNSKFNEPAQDLA